jgi:hypothetical protein
LLGRLGTPEVNPKPTQWPSSVDPVVYTAYVDFRPAGSLVLQPSSQYSVMVNDSDSWHNAALLFTRLPGYTSAFDWRMDATSSSNPFADGEFLKLAVNASLVPEPSAWAVALCGFTLMGVVAMSRGGRQKMQSERTGPNKSVQPTATRRDFEDWRMLSDSRSPVCHRSPRWVAVADLCR